MSKYVHLFMNGGIDAEDGAFDDWYFDGGRNVILDRFEITDVLLFRGSSKYPGGVTKGATYFPRNLLIAEWKNYTPESAGDLREMLRLAPSVNQFSPVNQTYFERSPGQRKGAFLAEAKPRTLFMIAQFVTRDNEQEYNHWFDVDDGSDGSRIISHFDERVSQTGFIRGTRFVAIDEINASAVNPAGSTVLVPNYITLYEVDNEGALHSPQYTKAPQNRKSAGGKLFKLVIRHTFIECKD